MDVVETVRCADAGVKTFGTGGRWEAYRFVDRPDVSKVKAWVAQGRVWVVIAQEKSSDLYHLPRNTFL